MKAYAATDIGKVRTMNQDFRYASTEPVGPLPNLLIVADGMGGHKAGDFASRYVTEHLVEYVRNSGEREPVAVLRNGISEVNRMLHEISLSREDLEGTGTTLVAATAEGNTLHVANVGDSRLYLIGREDAYQVTRDHSFVEEMVSMGQMKRESEEYQSRKNIITRAVGIEEKVDADFFEVPLSEGDIVLLCSDGLTNMVEDESIFRILHKPGTLQTKAEALIALANQNGGKDNIAVVLADPQISEVRRV